jgi:hypothetical protein
MDEEQERARETTIGGRDIVQARECRRREIEKEQEREREREKDRERERERRQPPNLISERMDRLDTFWLWMVGR